jgi:hypothetical protein
MVEHYCLFVLQRSTPHQASYASINDYFATKAFASFLYEPVFLLYVPHITQTD